MTKKDEISNEKMLAILDYIDEEAAKDRLPRIIGKESTLEEHIKYSLCRLFVIFIKSSGKKITELKTLIGIPKTRMSDITNYKISGYSLDRLFTYAEKLATIDPQTREHLNLMLEMLDGPVRSARESRRIKKEIRKLA